MEVLSASAPMGRVRRRTSRKRRSMAFVVRVLLRQAAEQFLEAGRILAQQPEALHLRYLTTLRDIAGERSSTIVFPLPIDMMRALKSTFGEPSEPGERA